MAPCLCRLSWSFDTLLKLKRTVVAQDASSFQAHLERLKRAVAGGINRLTVKLGNLKAQRAAQLRADHTRHLADLLTANLHLCRQGDTSIEVAFYFLLASALKSYKSPVKTSNIKQRGGCLRSTYPIITSDQVIGFNPFQL